MLVCLCGSVSIGWNAYVAVSRDLRIIACELLCAYIVCVPTLCACLFKCMCLYIHLLVCVYVRLYVHIAVHACVNNIM